MARKLTKPPSSSTTALQQQLQSDPDTTTTTSSSKPALPSILTDSKPLPRLIVFDLDYTLWPFWVDTHVSPPLRPQQPSPTTSSAVDRSGESFAFYADVPLILHSLARAGLKIGVASRTHAPDLARELLRMLYLPPAGAVLDVVGSGGGVGGKKDGKNNSDKPRRAIEAFESGGLEIYPGSKVRHMEALQRRTGVPFSEMLFFDDESRNRNVETLGVTMWLVPDGTSWSEVDKGIREWRRRRGVV